MARIQRRIVWSGEAISDAERLFGFLDQIDPMVTNKAASVIFSRVKSLAELPNMGRLSSNQGNTRELIITYGAGAYIIRYRLELNIVVIIRVWHTREDRS